ncbi:MAG: acylneuraminate cytidylyltransferase family protein [Oscillospiraceae bacterium]|jgi:CMP-N-acetylneuraminic acid synthetase|nr:acylneuraminate cytidylyltransferase family protein [Oscillospiraceae bacterium]
MYKEKTFLAIIPARSNSVGFENKNIRLFAGKPLMYYSIKQAIDSGIFDTVFVSTDDKNYAKIAKSCGATVPFLRPKELSLDTSLADEYVINSMEEFNKIGRNFDFFVILQPTSPLRSVKNIKEAADLLIDENLDSVISVCPADYPLEYYGEIPKDLNMHNFSSLSNRQKFKKTYRVNGALYFCNCKKFLKERTFYLVNSRAYIMDEASSIDIDTRLDFEFAEFIYLKNKK